MKTKLIRVDVCHDVGSDDPIAGKWHKGWRMSGCEAIALLHKRQWYRSFNGELTPHKSKQEALTP